MSFDPNWIVAGGSVVTSFGVIMAWRQIVAINEQTKATINQTKADHERSRREKAVELMLEWSKNLKENGALARKIVESLNEEQCRCLERQEEIKVPKKMKNALVKLLELTEEPAEEVNGEITLNEFQSSRLRWHAMCYLNMLESVLTAWQYSVVDREVIEHQFSFLFAPEHGYAALEHFRTAAGGEKAFPAIEIFCNHLKEKRREILKQKANVA